MSASLSKAVGVVLGYALLAVAAHAVLGALIGIGVVAGIGFWWPVTVASIVSLIVVTVWARDGDPAHRTLRGFGALATTIAAALSMGALAVFLSDIDPSQVSQRSLPGDELGGDAIYRAAASVAFLLSAGVIEEVAVRSGIQFRLQGIFGVVWAEVVAGFSFVALHALRFDTLGLFAFLVVFAFVNGEIARRTQSATWPIVVHVVSNTIVLIFAFAFRL